MKEQGSDKSKPTPRVKQEKSLVTEIWLKLKSFTDDKIKLEHLLSFLLVILDLMSFEEMQEWIKQTEMSVVMEESCDIASSSANQSLKRSEHEMCEHNQFDCSYEEFQKPEQYPVFSS